MPLPAWLRNGMRLAVSAGMLLCACASDERRPPIPCPDPRTGEEPEVAGVFDYASRISAVRGTITFEQESGEVRVTDTTYENANDRALEGVATLSGNRLEMVLTPKNGDTDYEAVVDFVFADDGGSFCLLGFTDTNGDQGGPGSHWGIRR